MSLLSTLTDIWNRFQGELFLELAGEVGELHTKYRRLVAILDMVPVEGFVGVRSGGGNGRPVEDRAALARAFIAKAVWDFPTTRELLDRIACDPVLRRLCGWSRVGGIPSEATFSRAFGEFAWSRLPERMHEALVRTAFEDTIVVSRDSTAIEAREKPEPKEETARREPGRPRKGEEGARRPSRLQRQLRMERDSMIDELPRAPAVGSKKTPRTLSRPGGATTKLHAACRNFPTSPHSSRPLRCTRVRHRPPATAHAAEDPLRAYPTPLDDVGLPTAFGPVRRSTFASPCGRHPTPASAPRRHSVSGLSETTGPRSISTFRVVLPVA